MIITYQTLRKSVGFLGVLLVPVLILGTLVLGPPPAILPSVSAYYYTNMRNPLEGILCAIGLFLICYHGYSKQDSIISKLSGFFCICIAFLPTSDSTVKTDPVSTLHYICAGIFFALLAYMSVFLFTKSAGLMTKQKIQRNRVYRVCGIVMAAAILGIPFDQQPAITFLKPTLVLETIALTAFGVSWLIKGELILKDKSSGPAPLLPFQTPTDPSMTKSNRADNIEVAKNVAEIVALVIGAAWAVYNFNLKDRPGLALREKASSTLKWQHPEQDAYIHAEFYVTLENSGTSTFDVSKAKYWVWKFDPALIDSNAETKYIDIHKIKKINKELLYVDSFENKGDKNLQPDAPFIGTYEQGMTWSENLEFYLKPDPKKIVVFYIEFYKGDSTNREMVDYTYHWDYIGGIKELHPGGDSCCLRPE